MRPSVVTLSLVLLAPLVSAQVRDESSPARVPTQDPTGGAYTAPTPLFTPAASLPSLNVRARAGVEVQPASGAFSMARPILDLELGLPAGITLAAGTTWVGGTQLARREEEGVPGLGAYGQVRWQFLGRGRDTGLLGGASLTVKANGFRGGEPEAEASVSLQFRARRFEAGLQGTYGHSLGEEDESDVEARAFVAWRPLPYLALGISGQLRAEIASQGAEAARQTRCAANPGSADCLADLDVIAGATGSYTYERWQLGVLLGASSVGLARADSFRAGFYSQVSGAVRF